MKISIHLWVYFIFALAMVQLVLLGCSTTGSTVGGGGVGADGGPWPQRPAGSTASSTPATDQPPKAPLTVLLHASASKDQTLALNVAKVELNYDKDHWATVATGESIGKLQAQPLRADEKGANALLASGPVDRRKFTAVRLTFAKDKTAIEAEKTSTPLTVDTATMSIGEWTPDPKLANTLTLTVDGTKIEKTKASARLSTNAISAKTGIPTGAISGMLAPFNPAVQVEVLYGDTKIALGRSLLAADGSFTIANLPPGKYQLKIDAEAYKLAEPLTKPITVEEKAVTLEKMQLVEVKDKDVKTE